MAQELNSVSPRALIADDQPDVLEALRLLLKGEGFQTVAVSSPSAVLEALRSRDFDVLLMDLNYARDTTSGQEGLNLLSQIQALDSTLPVVVMTAWGSVELAIEAMHRGVQDFVQKPWENERLLAILRAQTERVGNIPDRDLRQNVSITYELVVPSDTRLRSSTGSGNRNHCGRSRTSECKHRLR